MATQTRTITHRGVTYTQPSQVRFVEDMLDYGFDVELYHGRNFWHGPAVRTRHLQDVLSETRVRCQSDQLGLGLIVYPVASDPSLKDAVEEYTG